MWKPEIFQNGPTQTSELFIGDQQLLIHVTYEVVGITKEFWLHWAQHIDKPWGRGVDNLQDFQECILDKTLHYIANYNTGRWCGVEHVRLPERTRSMVLFPYVMGIPKSPLHMQFVLK